MTKRIPALLLFAALAPGLPRVPRPVAPVSPVPIAQPSSKTLLAVFAHPDDEILVAPLLSMYARRGVRVHLAIVTDGEKGVEAHAGIPAGPQLAKVRAEEARCSCRALGIEEPTLLGFKDGELGQIASPPWRYLADVRARIGKMFEDIRPDAVITFGADGAYGHPDHRLVGNLVTELVQAGVPGAPSILLYPGFPKDRLANAPQIGFPWAPTEPRFLTVRVPYETGDVAAARNALACHKSQFPASQVDPLVQFMSGLLGGRVYLRPWTGSSSADDVFAVKIP
jgi:LmbE family N-acetylglucosaminyl deacetylase